MKTSASDRVDDLQQRRVGHGSTLGHVGRCTGAVESQVQGVAVGDGVFSDLIRGQGRDKVENTVLDERVFLVGRGPFEFTVTKRAKINGRSLHGCSKLTHNRPIGLLGSRYQC